MLENRTCTYEGLHPFFLVLFLLKFIVETVGEWLRSVYILIIKYRMDKLILRGQDYRYVIFQSKIYRIL